MTPRVRNAAVAERCSPLVATLLFTGCTSLPEYVANGFKVGPSYGRPPAPVAQDWIDAGPVRIRRDETEPIACIGPWKTTC